MPQISTLEEKWVKVSVVLDSINGLVAESQSTLKQHFDEGFQDAINSDSLSQKVSLAGGLSFAFVIIVTLLIVFKMSKSLQKIADTAGAAAQQVASASNELAQSSEKLSSGAQEQASSVEETSASLTEIAGMASSNISIAEQTQKSVNEVLQISQVSQKSMEQLSAAMNTIMQSNIRIEKLVNIIQEIGEKTQIIDDIVFKTQLLSFNASVEAERAGEHGRGFSVVAQEVGNLAQLSGKAALEISAIVKSSIKEAESAASENKVNVVTGEKLATETKEKIGSALSALTHSLNNISKIVDASKEQGSGINQISISVDSISHLTQETASVSEESASAGTELASQAASLMAVVKELNEFVNGKSNKNDKIENNVVPKNKSQTESDFSQTNVQLKVVDDVAISGKSDNWDKL